MNISESILHWVNFNTKNKLAVNSFLINVDNRIRDFSCQNAEKEFSNGYMEVVFYDGINRYFFIPFH